MTVPDLPLDDLRFQPLVNEARARVHELCPEWTEGNVSDPGITLIELFAWMTEQLSYRLNRLPEKLHVALLALLDTRLYPPTPATADLRFRLERPPEVIPRLIPARRTEVSTKRAPGQDPVVFQTLDDFSIRPFKLDVCLLRRGPEHYEAVSVSDGIALPSGEDQQRLFNTPPRKDDALLLGFDAPLDRLLLHIKVECARARWVGVHPQSPPLKWEASTSSSQPGEQDETWVELEKLSDTTEGFNEGDGDIELQMPPGLARHWINGYPRQWLRCRLTQSEAVSGQQYENHPPRIYSVRVFPIGAMLPAEHSHRVEHEALGRSDGTPGQVFRVQRAPVLTLEEGKHEGLEVSEPGPHAGPWIRWKKVETFAESTPKDLHYTLDAAAGEIEFGPVVRMSGGAFRPYGAIPPKGAELRFTYRHGGGALGNVAAETLTRLRHPVEGVRSVSNPKPASGGFDVETVESARARKAIELRTRDVAITARDFEQLCRAGAPNRVARAHCLPGKRGERVRVLIVPRIDDPRRKIELRELTPLDGRLQSTLVDHLEERRLVGVTLEVCAPEYVVVTAVVRVIPTRFADARALERRIEHELYAYLNPLAGGVARAGWEFGRSLGRGELYPLVQSVEGVDQITLLRVYEGVPAPENADPVWVAGDLLLESGQLIASGSHQVKVEEPKAR
jgi:predicted phage baseplate assembly protein